MKTIYINSYYSEDEDVTDGLYKVTYDDSNFTEHDITHLVHITYVRMQDEDENGEYELVKNLGEVLEVLKNEHNIISWEQVDSLSFDCDYGNFDEE